MFGKKETEEERLDEPEGEAPAKARTKLVELPSGTGKFEIKRMRGRDEDLLSDVVLARKGLILNRLILNCTEGITQEMLDEMLIGDKTYLSMEIRRFSKGDFWYPKVNCPVCKAQFEAEVDLNDLKVQKLDRSLVNEELEYDLVLPYSGVKLHCRLLRGKDEKDLADARKSYGDRIGSFVLMLKTVRIEGVSHKSIGWFRDLDSEDTDFFRAEADRHDCGVETSFKLSCSECQSEVELDLPLDHTFFLRSGKKKEKA